MTDPEVIAQLSDRDVTALTVWAEARGESIAGKVAVGNVLRNRVATGRFGFGYRGVCLRPKQFSCWNVDDSANYQSLMAAAATLRDSRPPGPVLRECLWVAEGVMFDKLTDNTHAATHYLRDDLYQTGTVAWTKDQTPVARIGAHVFFAGVK